MLSVHGRGHGTNERIHKQVWRGERITHVPMTGASLHSDIQRYTILLCCTNKSAGGKHTFGKGFHEAIRISPSHDSYFESGGSSRHERRACIFVKRDK